VISDEELIKGCIRNKRKYQKALYDKYASDLLSICYRYFPDVNRSNDVLQESFIKIFRKIDTFKHDGSFEGWLKRITANTAINLLRSEKKHQGAVDLEYVTDSDEQVYDDSSYILAEVANLPENSRNVFNLFTIEGYSAKETASLLNMTEANVRVLNHRAKKTLQTKLEKYYIES